jgi:hypothetical protein
MPQCLDALWLNRPLYVASVIQLYGVFGHSPLIDPIGNDFPDVRQVLEGCNSVIFRMIDDAGGKLVGLPVHDNFRLYLQLYSDSLLPIAALHYDIVQRDMAPRVLRQPR